MNWIAGLIAGVVAYLVDWVVWSKVFTKGMDAFMVTIRHRAVVADDLSRDARQQRVVRQGEAAADGDLLGVADPHERGRAGGGFAREVIKSHRTRGRDAALRLNLGTRRHNG